jgi:hypothetical protein
MSEINLVKFYPANGTTDAAEANANNGAINGSTGRIDGQNTRLEGIDMVNLSGNPHILYVDRQDNQAFAPLATAPATYNGWIYNAFTITGSPSGQHFSLTGSASAVMEYPINHDNLFAINTAVNKGTKMQVNGTNGIALQQHQQLQVQWNVNVWDILHNGNVSRTSPASYMSVLVDSATAGIGVGEYYYFIYPKFNTVSSNLNNSEFKSADNAGFYQDLGDGDYFAPEDLVNGSSDTQFAFSARRFDHCSIVPMHLVTSTETASGGGRFATYQTYDFSTQDYQSAGGPHNICGQHTFEVNVAGGGGKTLYGVQMFISGPWRLNADGCFLESEITDPSATPAKNGVDVSIVLERSAVELEIITPASGRRSI